MKSTWPNHAPASQIKIQDISVKEISTMDRINPKVFSAEKILHQIILSQDRIVKIYWTRDEEEVALREFRLTSYHIGFGFSLNSAIRKFGCASANSPSNLAYLDEKNS